MKPTVKLDQKALTRHKKRFLRFFPNSFQDQQYIDWERTYKWEAHKLFQEHLARDKFKTLMNKGQYDEIAMRALQVEARTNFIFSFEKMALRDGVKAPGGARTFAEGLYGLLYERGPLSGRFIQWLVALADLPRKKSRVLSWPVATFFPFIAQPGKHIILKPTAMKAAATFLETIANPYTTVLGERRYAAAIRRDRVGERLISAGGVGGQQRRGLHNPQPQ